MKAIIKKLNLSPILENIEMPKVTEDSQVLIKVGIVGLCRTDLLVANGSIEVFQDLILGHEFSGVVVDGNSDWLGKSVAVNPLTLDKKFFGLDLNGALAEYVVIGKEQLVDASNVSPKVAAYLEPVAASMAILNAKLDPTEKGAIYGKNRIAELSYIIAKSMGLNVTWISENDKEQHLNNYYDYIVETLFSENDLNIMFDMLKENGKLIVKSRKKQPVAIEAYKLVSKNLTLQAVNYYDFNKAMKWLEVNAHLIKHLLGDSYPLINWEEAFEKAHTSESKKIFIQIS